VTTPDQHFNNRVLDEPQTALVFVVEEDSDPSASQNLPLPSYALETYRA
jgi:hypothetical protein